MKKKTCPKCGSKKVKELFYGIPTNYYNPKTMILAGCFYDPKKSPLYACQNCNKKFREEEK